jgi:hypothetical protein
MTNCSPPFKPNPCQTEETTMNRTAAKISNMDGDTFEQWLCKVSNALDDFRGSWGPREWQVRAFNCNYDPIAAASQIRQGRATIKAQ